ncbi:MAG: YfhO family protein [Lachnospiraceae bacterium]|nr:YfhO family protein [Lachnospiraceae bacterium]
MEKLFKRIKLKYYWIVAFLLGTLGMYVMLSYAQMLSTGKYILLADDGLYLYAAEIRMCVKNILHGESLWYSFANCLGANTAAGLAGVMFNPFNILFILFPKADVNIIAAVIVIAKTGTAAAAFQIFSSKVLKIRNFYSILFALFYSMCSFGMIYGPVHFNWLDGLYILPLTAIAVYKAVREGKYFLLAISYAYIFIAQPYQGFLMAVFGLLYFALLLGFSGKEKRTGPVWIRILKFLFSFLTAVLIAAFVLLPAVLCLRTYYTFDFSVPETKTTLMQVFNNLFWGEIQNFTLAPYVYCGVPCLLLLPFYFTEKRIPAKERTLYGILLAVFAIACIFPPVLAFLQAFDRSGTWNYRFAFIITFLLCTMACRETVYIRHIKAKSFLVYGIFLLVFFIAEGRLEKLEIGGLSKNNLMGLAINAAFILVWTVLVWAYITKRKYRMTLSVLVLFVTLFECIGNGCFCLSSDEYRALAEKEGYYYAWSDDMDYVFGEVGKKETGDEFYRMIILGDYHKNSDADKGYNGLTDYGFSGNERIKSFMRNIGFYVEENRISVTGYTEPSEMLLGVKYNARLHSDMVVLGYDSKPDIKENGQVLPIGFMVEKGALNHVEMTDNVFENQNVIFQSISGVDGMFEPVSENLITVDTDGLILSEEENPVIYADNSGSGLIVFRVSETDNPVYMQIASSVLPGETEGLYYDISENMASGSDSCPWISFAAKLWESGSNHYLSLRSGDGFPGYFPTDDIYIYELNRDKMTEAEESLKSEPFVTEIIRNGYMKGRVSVKDDRRVLFLSVPYEEGWKVNINNTDAECVPVLNGTFLGVVLPDKGEYEIELKYHCPGAKAGGFISLAGLGLLALLLVTEMKKYRKR